MATQEKTWNVANRMHSQKDSDNPAVDHIVAGADEIYDDDKQIKQSEHNAQTDSRLSTVEDEVADKTYDPLAYSGLGRVYLRKNMVNGVNVLTQDMLYKGEVGSRVPNTNTIFVIQYDFDLGNVISNDLSIPNDSSTTINGATYFYKEIELPAGKALYIKDVENCTFIHRVLNQWTVYDERYVIANEHTLLYIASKNADTYTDAYIVEDVINIPSDCTLQFDGGSLKNGAINLNNCQILGTFGFLGDNVVIGGKPSSEVYPDFFCCNSDAEKIERAIEQFHSIRLLERDYIIDRPINISNSFKIEGYAIPDYFTNYRQYSDANIVKDNSGSRLIADDGIECIIKVDIEWSLRKYISFVINGVSFAGQNLTSSTDGIKFSTPYGPSRPAIIQNCNFKWLNRAIYVYDGSGLNKNTNLATVTINGCNMTNNNWAIYATGNAVVMGWSIIGNNMEANRVGGIYIHNDNEDIAAVFSYLNIEGNMLEGSLSTIAHINAANAYIRFVGNYFEPSIDNADVIIINKDGLTEIKQNSLDPSSSRITWKISGIGSLPCMLDFYQSGINTNCEFANCYMLNDFFDSKIKSIQRGSFNMSAPYKDISDSENVAYSTLTSYDRNTLAPLNYVINGKPSFHKVIRDSDNCHFRTTFLQAGTYTIVFYAISDAYTNSLIILSGSNSLTTIVIPSTRGKLRLFNSEFTLNETIENDNLFTIRMVKGANAFLAISDIYIVKKVGEQRIPFGFPIANTASFLGILNPYRGLSFFDVVNDIMANYTDKWIDYSGTPLIATVSGTLKTVGGTNIPGFIIRFLSNNIVVSETRSDGNGEYSVDLIINKDYSIVVLNPVTFAVTVTSQTTFTLQQDDTTINIETAACAVTGTVKDANNNALIDALVKFERTGFNTTVRSDNSGNYDAYPISSGTYNITVTDSNNVVRTITSDPSVVISTDTTVNITVASL